MRPLDGHPFGEKPLTKATVYHVILSLLIYHSITLTESTFHYVSWDFSALEPVPLYSRMVRGPWNAITDFALSIDF